MKKLNENLLKDLKEIIQLAESADKFSEESINILKEALKELESEVTND